MAKRRSSTARSAAKRFGETGGPSSFRSCRSSPCKGYEQRTSAESRFQGKGSARSRETALHSVSRVMSRELTTPSLTRKLKMRAQRAACAPGTRTRLSGQAKPEMALRETAGLPGEHNSVTGVVPHLVDSSQPGRSALGGFACSPKSSNASKRPIATSLVLRRL